MSQAPVLRLLKPGRKRPPPAESGPGSNSSVAWSTEDNQPVEVVTPDQYCADLLLGYAAPMVPAELLSGAGWVVRLQAPPAGTGGWWMLEVLSLLDRWLESALLPCAKVLYGGHSYLIRSSTEAAEPGGTPRSALSASQASAQ